MAEALSQSQIDELLNKMRTGGMEELEQEEAENAARAKEKEYDFSSPKKFTKDQLKSLNSLYETLRVWRPRMLQVCFAMSVK